MRWLCAITHERWVPLSAKPWLRCLQGKDCFLSWWHCSSLAGLVRRASTHAESDGGLHMRTALDMAERLQQKSLHQIALDVAVLNHAPIPNPLSLRAVMKLFANVAMPEP